MKLSGDFSEESSGEMSIVHIGGGIEPSGCYARAIEMEMPGVKLKTFDDIDSFLNAGIDESVQLIIAEVSHRSQLLDRQTVIEARFPHKVICLAYDDKSMLTGCLEAMTENRRLRSFLPMNMRLDIWLAAIRLMLSGGSYIPNDMMRLLETRNEVEPEQLSVPFTSEKRRTPAHNISRLTLREKEVLKLVSQGQQNKNVAAELGLSEHTIKLHMHHIFSKLGVSNRTQAAAVFQREAVH